MYGNALRIPEKDGSIDSIYSSHMLEHVWRDDAPRFLAECRRVLRPGGSLRIMVPDLANDIRSYTEGKVDANGLLKGLDFPLEKPSRIALLQQLLLGHRCHLWHYDEKSLKELVVGAGFCDVTIVDPGLKSGIPGAEKLDSQRHGYSVTVEARRPLR